MAGTLPRTIEEMRHVSGIGKRKLELYGEQFLALILDHLRDHAPSSAEKEPDGSDQHVSMGTYESSRESGVDRGPGKESPGVAPSLSNPDVAVEQIPNDELCRWLQSKELIATCR